MTTREEALEAALRELATRFDKYVAEHQPPGEDPAMFVRARAALAMPVAAPDVCARCGSTMETFDATFEAAIKARLRAVAERAWDKGFLAGTFFQNSMGLGAQARAAAARALDLDEALK
jgi:uncharacterized phage protein gp47/JayE